MSDARPAPIVELSRIYRDKIDIIVRHNEKSSNRLTVTRGELAQIEKQIASILRPGPLDCTCTYNTHRPPGQSTRTDVYRNKRCPLHNPIK